LRVDFDFYNNIHHSQRDHHTDTAKPPDPHIQTQVAPTLAIMAKKTSKAGSSTASAPPKATNNNDFDIDDIFSGKPLKSNPAPVASSSSSAKAKAVDITSTSKAKKDKKKKKAVGDGGDEVQAGIAVNGVKGKRKAESDGVVESATKSKKSKTTSEFKPSKTSKSVQKKLRDDDDEDDEEDLDEDYTDEDDDEDDEPSTPKVVEVLDPSAVSRSKVKQALQPPPSRSKGGRREVDVEEEMFRDSRGDGPSTSHAASHPRYEPFKRSYQENR
jgi:hypothetical protein